MKKRHVGWFLHRIKELKSQQLPQSDNALTKFNSYRSVSGLELRLIRFLVLLSQKSRGFGYRRSLSALPLAELFPNFFIKPAVPDGFNSYYLRAMSLIRLLLARSYKVRRMCKLKPAHGQRTWSNAKTAKTCNQYLYSLVRGYETDLYKYEHKQQFKWSKLWELRQKAQMRKRKVKKKKWAKFRKFGERRLALKKKKKTPWD